MEETKKNLLPELLTGIIASVLGVGCVIAAFIINFQKASVFVKSPWYEYLLFILGAVILFIGLCAFYRFYQDKKDVSKKMNTRQMTLIAFMSAITIVLYYYAKFSLPFFPGWLDIQVSEVPALITSFIYGPMAGIVVIFVRFLCKAPATITCGVGELADLILGCVVVGTTGLIYKKHRTFKGALIGTGIAMLLGTFTACITNWLILIPAYMKLAGFGYDTLISMMSYIPNVTESNFMVTYIFVGVIPFNLFRYAIVFAITFILYKRTHWLFDKIAGVKNINEDKEAEIIEEETIEDTQDAQ